MALHTCTGEINFEKRSEIVVHRSTSPKSGKVSRSRHFCRLIALDELSVVKFTAERGEPVRGLGGKRNTPEYAARRDFSDLRMFGCARNAVRGSAALLARAGPSSLPHTSASSSSAASLATFSRLASTVASNASSPARPPLPPTSAQPPSAQGRKKRKRLQLPYSPKLLARRRWMNPSPLSVGPIRTSLLAPNGPEPNSPEALQVPITEDHSAHFVDRLRPCPY